MKTMVLQAMRGDPDAFVALIESYKQDLYKVARGFFRSNEQIADVIQDTILTCYEKLADLRHPQYFKTWLTRILIHKCIASKAESNRYTGMDAITENGYIDQGQANAEFSMIMEQLDEHYRLVLILYYAQDCSIRQISELLGISQDAVKTRLKRGRHMAKDIYLKAEVIL